MKINIFLIYSRKEGPHWIEVHNIYMCKLNIGSIYVLDFYFSSHQVSAEELHITTIYEEQSNKILKSQSNAIILELKYSKT